MTVQPPEILGFFFAFFINTFASGGGLDGPTYLTFTPATAPIPEPGTLTLLLSGLAGVAVGLRRRER